MGRPEDTHHSERVLGHLFTLVEAISDLQPCRGRRLSAEQGLVGRITWRIIGKEPPRRERERLPPPRKGREIRTVRRHVAKSSVGVSDSYWHSCFDARILLQIPVIGIFDVRRCEI